MAIRAVGAIVYQLTESGELQILLIKKRGGMWTLPKGKVRRGEDDRAALLRELAEETGLNGRVGELVSQATYTIIKRGRRRRKVVTYYLVYATGGHLQPGTREGIEQVRWMPVPRALQRIGRARIRAVLRAGLAWPASGRGQSAGHMREARR